MTWIKTVQPGQADAELQEAMGVVREMYPPEYGSPVESLQRARMDAQDGSIVQSHSLLPQALRHAFATYGSLLLPDLPLSRKQHEMIATTVSVLNKCFY